MSISHQLLDETMQQEGFDPRSIDVLCGRGRTWCHPGNQNLTLAIHDNLPKYIKAKNNFSKSLIVSSVLDSFRDEGSLFLKNDAKTKRWYDVGGHQARQKIGHAFRDQVATLNKKKQNTPMPTKRHAMSIRMQQHMMTTIAKKASICVAEETINQNAVTPSTTISTSRDLAKMECNRTKSKTEVSNTEHCANSFYNSSTSLENNVAGGFGETFKIPFTLHRLTKCDDNRDVSNNTKSSFSNDSSHDDLVSSSEEIVHWYRINGAL